MLQLARLDIHLPLQDIIAMLFFSHRLSALYIACGAESIWSFIMSDHINEPPDKEPGDSLSDRIAQLRNRGRARPLNPQISKLLHGAFDEGVATRTFSSNVISLAAFVTARREERAAIVPWFDPSQGELLLSTGSSDSVSLSRMSEGIAGIDVPLDLGEVHLTVTPHYGASRKAYLQVQWSIETPPLTPLCFIVYSRPEGQQGVERVIELGRDYEGEVHLSEQELGCAPAQIIAFKLSIQTES
jgi:hypothetical protein